MAFSDHVIISNLGGVESHNLISILDIEDNEPQSIQHSSYYDTNSFKKLITNHTNICSVLSLNIQSINAKFSELETFVEELHNSQFKFYVICLQECWIRDQSDTCPFQIPGYDCVAQGKSSSERGGLITCVDNLSQYEVRKSIKFIDFLRPADQISVMSGFEIVSYSHSKPKYGVDIQFPFFTEMKCLSSYLPVYFHANVINMSKYVF